MKTVKFTSIILALCICFLSFCACSPSHTALTVNSAPVSKGVFGYFLSVAVNSDEYREEENKQEIASRLCAEYVAGLSLLKKHSVTLSPEEKVVVSSKVKTSWQLYSDFYNKYSVSKQDLCLMLEYEALTDALTEKLYSKGGEREVNEEEVKAFFNQNYAAAKIAYTAFNRTMQESEVKDITDKFTSMASVIRAGGEFSSAIEQYPDLAEFEDTEHIISAFDTSYPDGFFKNLAGIKTSDTQVMRFSRGIYLVQKADSQQFFDIYKSKCIIKMKKEQVLSEISALAETYKIEPDSSVIKNVMSSAGV
ncbi:MAG: hypothetical protein IJZ57_07840 [Clostridia bacterium]|nr:hypothetical protein [Clostridia bacterium]